MEVFINGMSCISPCTSVQEDWFFENYTSQNGNKLQAIEPDYKEHIPANLSRRMSHVIKMGVTTAQLTLKQSQIQNPDAIVTGTGLGCFEDTDKFLRSIGENNEQMLAPTSFIQSTHNTVAGQIALIIKCHNYNFTYVHQGLSFESALFDGMLKIEEGDANNILVGGMDELIPATYEMFDRAGHLRSEAEPQNNIGTSTNKGIAMGEGAAFFMLSSEKNSNSICKIKNVELINRVKDVSELENKLDQFLLDSKLKLSDIDLILLGNNGDVDDDIIINQLKTGKLKEESKAFFKHICGEYFTSGAFACWLAAKIIEVQKTPVALNMEPVVQKNYSNILVINHYRNMEYSLMCVSSC